MIADWREVTMKAGGRLRADQAGLNWTMDDREVARRSSWLLQVVMDERPRFRTKWALIGPMALVSAVVASVQHGALGSCLKPEVDGPHWLRLARCLVPASGGSD